MTHRILIVEDDRDLLFAMTARLRCEGFDVIVAEDAYSAVGVARSASPDLALLDIGLPGGGGLSVLQRFDNIAHLAAVPVVVITGRDPEVIEPAVRRFGVAGFLRKPADDRELIGTIRRALRGYDDPTARPWCWSEVVAWLR
jgi:DNA-binding response OmpR family regulator